ncbi:MAG: type I DNA topoisomerase [Eubacteriales bacterium]|nr:type I DNA topoisomerase [Eubacteriales bacterium]
MGKNLVIVESPAKAKTIGRYLGQNYRITASVGHIRDLPASKIGVDVDDHFKPQYITMKGKEKVIAELKDMASTADRIFIATDPDREGEAIAWHIAQILKIDETSNCRITFNEITEPAVTAAVDHPRSIDMNLVNSQQARRILDRLVGYELSPLLWKKVRKGLSAGRVQSVATKIVVDREREISKFKPEEYWLLTAFLHKKAKDPTFKARYHGELVKGKVEKVKLGNQAQTEAVYQAVDGQPFTVAKVKLGNKQKQPYAPFTTSTLQQEASRYLGFTAKKTMSVAQQLYEGVELPKVGAMALVTYIRTDSVRVSTEAEQEARNYILEKYGPDYLPKSPRKFQNRNKTQDAHEAIRPAHFDLPPHQIKAMISADQFRLYQLIWDKFMASQMAAASVDTVVADITCQSHLFRVSGETIKFPGFLAQYGVSLVDSEPEKETDDELKQKLPQLTEGETLLLDKLTSEQKFTLPPARYTEASLIKAMEEKGIGRPSTYAPTISTILDRKYVEKDKKYLLPTELGKAVTELLEKNFESIVDVTFTAGMEKDLDTVESGENNWVEVLNVFYPPFHEKIVAAGKTVERVKIADVPTGEKCPLCLEGDLVIKEGRFGKFIACSNYPTCKHTKNIEVEIKAHCPKCGSGLVQRVSKKFKGSRFYTCDKQGQDPNCDFISWDLPIDGSECKTCGSYMVLKRFKGRTYPKCGSRECPSNQKKEKPAEVTEQTEASDQVDTKTETTKD